ncbi:hypothetical protein JCM1840_000884 [Sporobolomyces johnsonii]
MPPVRRSETAPRRSTRTPTTAAAAVKSKVEKVASKVVKKAKSTASKAASAVKPKVEKGKKEAKKAVEKKDVHKVEQKRKAPTKRAPPKQAEASGDEDIKGKYKVGDVVEDITLKNEDDKDISLAELYNQSGLVIFSYPKANTPGCTTQACGFRDAHASITALGYEIYGLSRDKPSAQSSWKTKHELGYSLLCDPEQALLKKLGATEAQKRCHWVVEKGGKLLEAKIGVKPADDPKNALAFIKSLSGSPSKEDDEKMDDAPAAAAAAGEGDEKADAAATQEVEVDEAKQDDEAPAAPTAVEA